MSDTTNPPVALTGDEILELIKALGGLIVAVNPTTAAAASLVVGTAQLVDRLVDRLRALGSVHLSVAQQEQEKAWHAANRVRVGAPASPGE